ncbi:MAG: tetratricopeptide repeat protein, partial [Terriglobia bacterium]
MAFNKAKAIDQAQKLIAQGTLKDAVTQYQKILKLEPKEPNVLNTLGDLHVRLKKTDEAIAFYILLADSYAGDGFLVRAIAMYKKISKLVPGHTRCLERLAELYTMQGLMSDARAQYLQLAECFLKNKQPKQAMGILHKVLDLEPDNVRIQQKLAELYERHDQKKEAAGIYRRLAQHFLQEENLDESRKWLRKAVAAAPQEAAVVLLKAQVEERAGQAKEALATVEGLGEPEKHPQAAELLLRLRLATGNTKSAEEMAEKLFAENPAKFWGLLQLAEQATRDKDGARALALLKRVAEPALEHDPQQLLETVRHAAELAPESNEAYELLAEAGRRAGNHAALAEALSHLAQTAFDLEDLARAKDLYDELVTLEPQNPDFVQNLNRVREKLGEPIRVSEPAPALAAEATGAACDVLDDDTRTYVNAALTDIDLFSSYGMTEKAIELAHEVIKRVPSHMVAHERLLDFYVGTGNERGVVAIARKLENLYREAGNNQRAEEVVALASRYGAKLEPEALEALEAPPAPTPEPAPEAAAPAEPEPALHEVDLSDEWDALATEEAAAAPPATPAAEEAPADAAAEMPAMEITPVPAEAEAEEEAEPAAIDEEEEVAEEAPAVAEEPAAAAAPAPAA